MTCACDVGFLPSVCAATSASNSLSASNSASASNSPLASVTSITSKTSVASASSSYRGVPQPQSALSPGAIAGILIAAVTLCVAVFVAQFGGGPVLSSMLTNVARRVHGASRSSERASLLARAKRGSPVSLPPQTSAVAAARFSSL